MEVEQAIAYLESALKRAEDPKVYEIVAKVGSDFLACMKPEAEIAVQIDKDTISMPEQISLYGPFKILQAGLCIKETAAPSKVDVFFLRTGPLEFLARETFHRVWKEASAQYKAVGMGTYKYTDKNKNTKIFKVGVVSDEDKKKLRHIYIKTLRDIFERNKAQPGIIKFCERLQADDFAMLKPDHDDDIKVKEENFAMLKSGFTVQADEDLVMGPVSQPDDTKVQSEEDLTASQSSQGSHHSQGSGSSDEFGKGKERAHSMDSTSSDIPPEFSVPGAPLTAAYDTFTVGLVSRQQAKKDQSASTIHRP